MFQALCTESKDRKKSQNTKIYVEAIDSLKMAFSRTKSSASEGSVITAIAVDRDKNSQFAFKWAVGNLLNNYNLECVLIHVRSQSLDTQDSSAVPREGRSPTQDESKEFFLPYHGFCARKGIRAKEVILHDIDIPSALVDYVTNNSITNIVVGASSRSSILRKFRSPDVPTSLLKSVPESCSVYVISRGRVQTARLASRPQMPTGNAAIPKRTSPKAPLPNLRPDTPQLEEINRVSSVGSSSSFQLCTDKLKSNDAASSQRLSINNSTSQSSNKNSPSDGSNSSRAPNHLAIEKITENLEHSIASKNSPRSSLSPTPQDLEAEMRRLRLALKQSMALYKSASNEATPAEEEERELQGWNEAEVPKSEEARLSKEAAFSLAEKERQKTKAVIEAAQMAQRLAELETKKRRHIEMRTKRKAEERKRVIDSLANKNIQYRKYTLNEIELATNYFSSSQKIGEGGYGPVYRATLDHTAVAIKVVRPDMSQGQKQFQKEVDILSFMRHPHMVLLLGACPEYGCLVYEYMENGSLEDRLFRKDNTPSIPWKTRFKIAAEIATGLLFLHQTKPEPLVHRDLKPANILLDRNYVTKISDVGLARLVPPSVADSITQYCMTAAAGTFCYIDPEYQQTGMLGVKSDLYSLGVVLLQILTAKPPVGLSLQVEKAIESGSFAEILDPTVPDWPVQEALSLATLALHCCELRKKDRPDLASVVLPQLKRLRDLELENEASGTCNIIYDQRPCKSLPSIETPLNQEGMTNNPNIEMAIQRRSI